MNSRQAAAAIRAFLGDLLIPHSRWGSLVDWSAAPARSRNALTWQVAHHNGATAQMPHVRAAETRLGSAVEAEMAQMRRVDHQHRNVNNWPNGFAYPVGVGAITGLLYEARSLWVPHGAHLGDPSKMHFPVYFMLGLDDDSISDGLLEGHYRVRSMLVEVFGLDSTAQTDHGSVPGNATSCAGLMRAVTADDRAGLPPATGSPTPVPPSTPGGIVSALPILSQTWFRPGDVTKPDVMRLRQRVRNLQALLAAHGFVAANTFDHRRQPPADGLFGPGTADAVRAFQRARGLQVDAKVGAFTWWALLGD